MKRSTPFENPSIWVQHTGLNVLRSERVGGAVDGQVFRVLHHLERCNLLELGAGLDDVRTLCRMTDGEPATTSLNVTQNRTVARTEGFEPPPSGSVIRRIIQLCYVRFIRFRPQVRAG